MGQGQWGEREGLERDLSERANGHQPGSGDQGEEGGPGRGSGMC